MALITINGVEYPDPVTYKPGIEPLGVWARNADGYLVGDLVAFKTKLELSWGILRGDQYSTLLNGVLPFFVDVTYWDPRVNDFATSEFYASPRTGLLALVDDSGVYWWKDVSFNLVER